MPGTSAFRILAVISLVPASIFADEPVVSGEMGRKLDEFLTRIEHNGFSGAMLVAKDGEVVLTKGYGLADREAGRPVTVNTVFDIGSITKQFTASAIVKLEMEGKLSVQDPLAKHFADVPPDRQTMTLHHLLTHSSGLRDNFGRDYEEMQPQTLFEQVMTKPLKWEPGHRYHYSNAGYSLLGMTIEKVSGMGYEEYLHSRFFGPAGMAQTGYRLPKWRKEDLAVGYIRPRTGRSEETTGGVSEARWGTPLEHLWADDGPYWNLRCNGGILSTVGDMYRWFRALQGDTILSKEAKEKLWYPHVPENPQNTSFYGYGWAIVTRSDGAKLVTHNGGNGVFFADFRWYGAENLVIIEMTNCDDEYPAEYRSGFHRAALGMDYELPPPAEPAWKKAGEN